jgi:hypothetical protein
VTVIMQFSNSVTLTFTLMSRSVWSLYTFSVRVTCKFLYIFVPVSTLLEYSNRCCRFFVLKKKKKLFLVILLTYDYEYEH